MRDLQTFPSKILEKELGISVAQRIQKLSFGEDDSPVTPSGPPQVCDDVTYFNGVLVVTLFEIKISSFTTVFLLFQFAY